MQYSELDDYEMFAGAVTVWRATAESEAAALDERPLAPQHERHVTVHTPGDTCDWIGTVFEIHHPYDAVAMCTALRQWHQRHEAFRTTPHHDGSAWRRLLVEPEAVDVVPEPDGSCQTGAQVRERVRELFDSGITPHQWPHLVVITVVPPEAGSQHPVFQLAFAADHSVMDAYSQVLAVTELQQLYADALAGAAKLAESPPPASYVEFSAHEHQLAASHSDSDTVTRWQEFFGPGEPEFPAFPLGLGDPRECAGSPQRSVNREFLSIADTDLVHRAARARGHGMQTAVLAALAEATRRTSNSDALKFVMPMHTRTATYQHAMGWFVGLSPVSIDLDLGQRPSANSLEMLLERCALATAHVRDDAAVPFPVIEDRLAVTTTPKFVMSFVDIRFVPGADQFDAVRARALRSSTAAADEVYLWVVRAASGMNISARFPNTDAASDAFERFIGAVQDVLLELGNAAIVETAQEDDGDARAA